MTTHERLVEHLSDGVLDALDRAHASRCAACAALLAGDAQAQKTPPPRQAWLDAAHRELAKPRRSWWVLALVLAAGNTLLATATVFVLEAWNWNASTSPRWLFLAAATVLAALVTAGALLALAPGRRWLQLAVGLAAVAPLSVLLASDGRVADSPFLAGAACLRTVVVLALLPLALGLWLLTRMAYSAWRALTVGLISGGVGLLALQFHCADGASPHLLVFHLLPWAALGGAAVLVRRLLPTSSFAP
jgi:uncharacterized membrane protein YhfC